ncbi:peptidyl-prolyl cis-trans isomerase C [Paracoccus solventivorans]|uniref:Parvulin-like PPIase n=1 Tax=Paracoccus solventivorans TaxID=53463 RepID=A0A1M7JPB2_9RHOB|nr:peptidylprolyl isomerase [Paracoccus solventivorans]SHM54387.1 peptidyl-prolyl cis-trans isomerase C [Paracoccus solventivorans]
MLKTTPAIVAAAALLMGAPALAQTAETPAAVPPAVAPPAVAEVTGAPRADSVVAVVNGEAITLGQMIAMKEGLQGGAGDLPDVALWDLMLDQMIRQTAVAQVTAQSLTPRDRAMLELDRRGYLSAATLERVAKPEPTEEELRAVYDAAFGSGDSPKTEYSAAHILVATEDEAKAIAEELAGGADFAALAAEKSTDNSAANGGDLGWFTAEMMVEPFAKAVEALEPGQVSAPVQSQFGWHLIRLNETREQTPPEFEQIREQLATQVRRNRVDAEIERLVSAASIEKTEGLAPELLNRTELLDN